MAFSIEDSIVPMSDLRANLDKVKKQLKKSPLLITNKGRPDFGLCDLETFKIAVQIKELKDLLHKRIQERRRAEDAEAVFKQLDDKYRE